MYMNCFDSVDEDNSRHYDEDKKIVFKAAHLFYFQEDKTFKI